MTEIPTPSAPSGPHHHLGRMTGRDPHESGRVSSPLELLFDLTFAVAFSTAGVEFAHLIAAGHIRAGLLGFCFSTFSIVWAWINFSWFASAYDTDDWLMRLLTMVQMVGVVVLALGLPEMFASLDEGGHFENRVMVMGYVVMRVAMAAQWYRAWRQDPSCRPATRTYLTTILLAQVGWFWVGFHDFSLVPALVLSACLVLVELCGPVLAERRLGGTPWHAHHIVERYSLLAIITLGEGVIGTVATLNAAVHEQGWSKEAILVVVAGIGLTFAMWWIYFAATMPDVLHAHRERSFLFGYVHIITFGAIAATGAGLHVAGLVMEGEATIDTFWAVASVAIPVGIYVLTIFALWINMSHHWDGLHTVLVTLTALVLGLALLLARQGVGMGECLLVVMCAPLVSVVGYELFGHRHLAETLERQAGVGHS